MASKLSVRGPSRTRIPGWRAVSVSKSQVHPPSYFAVGHRGSEANSHFYLQPCCHRQPQQHRRCCWEPLLFRRHTVSHDGCYCGSLDEALGPGRWSSGHNCLLDSGRETFRFRFRFYLSISPHVRVEIISHTMRRER